ncbi:lysozyme inhibitor LprI family protein [Microbulbifer sp. ZKSA006]|uniref:lysozyme inhibitor LprI family protein n=1 Tax=Microbulbifer sp. ZKSA006 TaxID=3243390 RepID=UPI004039E379
MEERTKIALLTLLCFSPKNYAINFEYKSVSDFNELSSFENNYDTYIQDCLDNTGGGTRSIPCLITPNLWDRELNIYYSKLREMLSDEEKSLLKQSQLAWLKCRDKTLELNDTLIDTTYPC